jgi:hypothetical protein
MYCPTCGIDNPLERKYCASCGTNLEVVSQALSGSADGFFTKVDTSLDQFIARYAEHVFKDAPVKVLDRRISRSWQILGQGVITSLVDLLLFNLMCVILPFRFLLLLVLTPIGLLTERSRHQKDVAGQLESKQAISFPDALPGDLPRSLGASVTEHTTRNLHK